VRPATIFQINFDELSYLNDVDGETNNHLAVDGKIDMQGFSLGWVPPNVAPYLPSEVHLDFSLSALPAYDLLQQLSLSTHSQLESGKPLKDMDLVPFRAPFMKSQTGVTLEHFSVETPALDLDGAGAAHLDANAKRGFVGEGSFTIRGIDETVAALTKAAEGNPKTKNIMPVFSLLMTLGKSATVNGVLVRKFDLKAGADGTLIVNDLDFGQLVQP
jgi:hypothetical protein